MDKESEIIKLQNVFDKTLKLISLYKKSGLTIPFALKGNLGEIIVAIELLKSFPAREINYRGGAFPGIDITINDVKIQVKTRIQQPPTKFRGGEYDIEGCPTIKKAILDDKKCDLLIFVVLYLDEGLGKIEKNNIYIFNQEDFKFFSPIFCWSGNSNGDYTIANILYFNGTPPPKLAEKINFYNNAEYKTLFISSRNNWDKIEILLGQASNGNSNYRE
jgi:hypothetical protein